MGLLERAIGLVLAALLAFFAYRAVGDDFPLNAAVAVLAFVVATALIFSVGGDDRG
jgi:hypothetical protein